jgi:hypothetical protein
VASGNHPLADAGLRPRSMADPIEDDYDYGDAAGARVSLLLPR